jgi:signal transduction histidine kinase
VTRRTRVLAWTAFGASCASVAAGAAVAGASGAPFGEDALLAVAFTGVGALIASREPGNRAAWICLTAVFAAFAYLAQAWASLPEAPGGGWAAWIAAWIWLPGLLPVLVLLPLHLPDGLLPGRRWRAVARVNAVVVVGSTVSMAVATAVAPIAPPPGSPAALLPLGLTLLCGLVALAGLAVRIGRARAQERAQLLWIGLGAVVLVLGSLLGGALPEPWAAVIVPAAALALPVAIAVAAVRHHLYDLNPLLRRMVLILVMAVVLVALFAAGRTVLGDGPVASTAVAVTLALSAPVLARWWGAGVDRLVYGRRGDPAAVLAGLSRRLAAAGDARDALTALTETVVGSLPVAAARGVLNGGERATSEERPGAARGPATHEVALRFGGMPFGRVEVVAPEGLDEADRMLLDDIAAAAAGGLAAAHRTLELRRSREQLVVAREQERRRLAHDLHDGVGPVLSGLGFTLDALRAALQGRPIEEAVAARAAVQVREAAAVVRSLSHGLRPAGLHELGLHGALRELAAQHTTPTLVVHVDLPDPAVPLAAATEVAVHSIVAEAVTNVARHAQADCCHITLRVEGEHLVLVVSDDGVGLRGVVAGLGRVSMVERADELGGRCTVESAGRGTTVTTVLPLLPAVPASAPG